MNQEKTFNPNLKKGLQTKDKQTKKRLSKPNLDKKKEQIFILNLHTKDKQTKFF